MGIFSGRRVRRFGCHQPRFESLEDRTLLDGMTLVANWNGNGPDYADLWAEGNFAYIGHSAAQKGVDIIDLSNPSNPVLAANFRGTADNTLRDITIQDGIAYFASNSATNGGVYVVDVHDPYH